MTKKMMLWTLAIGLLAIPSSASGQTLTEGGVALNINAKVTATSLNLEMKTPLWKIACAQTTIHGEVKVNSETQSTIQSTGASFEGCFHEGTVPAVLSKGSAHIQFGKAGLGSAALTFMSEVGPKPAKCHFFGSPLAAAYEQGAAVFSLQGTMASPCGNGEISGDFILETADGTPVVIE